MLSTFLVIVATEGVVTVRGPYLGSAGIDKVGPRSTEFNTRGRGANFAGWVTEQSSSSLQGPPARGSVEGKLHRESGASDFVVTSPTTWRRGSVVAKLRCGGIYA